MPDDLNQPKPTDQPAAPPEPPPGVPPAQPSPPIPPTPPTPPPSGEPPLVMYTPPKSRVKAILASIVILILFASIPTAVFLVQQRQEIREKAAYQCTAGECCDTTWGKRCSVDGVCNIPDVSCKAPSPTPSPTPTPTPLPGGNCPAGKSAGLGGFVNPDPGCQSQGGVYCHDSKKAYCCYNENGNPADGYEYCAEGQQGNCVNQGNGSICVKNGWSGTIFKRVSSTDVSCPFSGGTHVNVFSGTVSGSDNCGSFTGKIFSLTNNECGQMDGPCGSCKATGCGGPPGPTATPTPGPTATPTPGPTATPTPPSYQAQCVQVQVLRGGVVIDPSQIALGDSLVFRGFGATSDPADSIDKIEFTIKKDGAVHTGPTEKTATKVGANWQADLSFTVSEAGSYNVIIRSHSSKYGWKD